MEPLTEKQQQVLNYITAYLDTHACPPTLREISTHLNVKGTATAILHLDALERKGYIQRREGSSRSISITGRGGMVSIPIVGRVKAGLPSLAVENIEGYCNLDMNWVHDRGCFFLRVEGDSMINAHILDGDLALIRPQQTADNGDIVVVMVNDEATLKRFYRRHDHICLQPEHPTMVSIILPPDADVAIAGKLLKVVRNYP